MNEITESKKESDTDVFSPKFLKIEPHSTNIYDRGKY